jgi:hypothetical protein
MNKKNTFLNKKILFVICFTAFICAGFVFLPINKIFATELTYPTLSGINPSTSTSLPSYVKYIFLFGVFIGFFAVIVSFAIAGATWFLSPMDPSLRADAKDRIAGSISGLLILVLLYLIVTTLSPQLGAFTSAGVPIASPTTPSTYQPPGVYFFNISSCPSSNYQLSSTTSVPDLGALKNNIQSVTIVQGSGSLYGSILYSTVNFQGSCQIVDPTSKKCLNQNPPFTNSALIFKYDSNPKGDGVYFYRKDCFSTLIKNCNISYYSDYYSCACTNAGCLSSDCSTNGLGYYEITNSDILNSIKSNNLGYVVSLDSLKFTGNSSSSNCNVPKNDQDCTSYDNTGKCTNRSCPTLGGENISSVVINGNYIVLFIYKADSDPALGPWTYCESFPIVYDARGIGPLKLNWEQVRNQGGKLPNYVYIIPITQ